MAIRRISATVETLAPRDHFGLTVPPVEHAVDRTKTWTPAWGAPLKGGVARARISASTETLRRRVKGTERGSVSRSNGRPDAPLATRRNGTAAQEDGEGSRRNR
jgi:hypothetical protein